MLKDLVGQPVLCSRCGLRGRKGGRRITKWSKKHTEILRRQFVGSDFDFPALVAWAEASLHPESAEILILSQGRVCMDWQNGQAKFVPSRGTRSN